MNLDQAKQTFVIEARELIQSMEESLLSLEAAPEDKDTVDALFRSVHTIKGSGGIFGFDPIVAFAHVVEGVLGEMRNGKAAAGYNLIALLLSCGDHLRTRNCWPGATRCSNSSTGIQVPAGIRAKPAPAATCRRAAGPRRLPRAEARSRAAIGISRCASDPTCCVTEWTRYRSCAIWEHSVKWST